MTVKIISLYDKNEDFIELQYKTIKKFAKFKYEFVIFNNAIDDSVRKNIHSICKDNQIECIDLYNTFGGDPSQTVSNSFNAMWDILKRDKNNLFFMDNDMFFISEIDLNKEIENCDIIYIPQYRGNFTIEYLWPNIFCLNRNHTDNDIDFSIANINGVRTDTGGSTYYFLKSNNFIKKYLRFCTLADINDSYTDVYLNGGTERIRYIDNAPIDKPIRKFFPHETDNPFYLSNHILEYNYHKQIINKYDFPREYHFDLIKFENSENYFIFHYKSAGWEPRYGNGKNEYSINKKIALNKMIRDITE